MSLRVIVTLILLLPIVSLGAETVVINEFVAKNTKGIKDCDDDFSDWIELYNFGDEAVNLEGFYLSDDGDNKTRWCFPNITIKAKEYIIIFASGKDKNANGQMHTNFKIANEGEPLYLLNKNYEVIDFVEPVYLKADESYGRIPDGIGQFYKLKYPTPKSKNFIELNNQLIFSTEERFHKYPFYLKISSFLNDTIYYTLDGSLPTDKSLVFSDSLLIDYRYSDTNYYSNIPTTPEQRLIFTKAWEPPEGNVDKATIIRCATYRNGMRTSPIFSRTYFVDSNFNYSLPIVSIITEAENLFDSVKGIYVPGVLFDSTQAPYTGNYYQRGEEWEREIFIEYFDTTKSLQISQGAGLRIHGGLIRHCPQKSLRVYAREKYGEKKFNYKLLPNRENDKYDVFVLRSTGGDWFKQTMIKDVLCSKIASDLNVEYQDFQPVVVFINGEYWGIHFLMDRIDEKYISYLYGFDEDSIDMLEKGEMAIAAGSDKDYRVLLNFIRENDLSDSVNYYYVKNKIDIDNFIDYYIFQIFFANLDFPYNNTKYWKSRNPETKWRWVVFDSDASLELKEYNMFKHLTEYNDEAPEIYEASILFRKLLENQEFVSAFIKRFEELLKSNFKSELLKVKMKEVMNMISAEVPRHLRRWRIISDFDEWKANIQESILKFIEQRRCIVVDQINDFFGGKVLKINCIDNILITEEPNFINYYDIDISNLIKNINPVEESTKIELQYDYSANILALFNNDENEINIKVQIYDLLGRLISQSEEIKINPHQEYNMRLNYIQNGVYFIVLIGNNVFISQKIIFFSN